MALQIPLTTDSVLREGDYGLAVFALQRTCNKVGIALTEDFAFGPKTKAGAIALQKLIGVTPDGYFGPVSQATTCRYLCTAQESKTTAYLPKNLLISNIDYESSGYFGAVNWGIPGGVDVSITQRRIYQDQYANDALILQCFDPVYQIQLLARNFIDLYNRFLPRPEVAGNKEKASRLAVLNHNYPAAADRLSRTSYDNLSSYWTTPQTWVSSVGIKFPDGTRVTTPYQWCQRYSLGSITHKEPGQAVKFVTRY